MESIYVNLFGNKADIEREFDLTSAELTGADVLLAYYSYEDYSGDAFVLFRKDGKLFEVNGGHCYCYGLEGQWAPEETSIDSLKIRLDNGLGSENWRYDEPRNLFANELRTVLSALS